MPRRIGVTTLQLNLGRVCNLACSHCHIDAGPGRTESMTRDTLERALELLDRRGGTEVEAVDLTGGAPELHPDFRFAVRQARRRSKRVIDRCNLTVLLLPGQQSTAEFLAEQGVEIVASLPCYTDVNVDAQRGRGVFSDSIEALRRLNALGYGREGSGLQLDLVYNPLGSFLPGCQLELELAYKRHLGETFGIEFHRLLTITNMPIKRFRHRLESDQALDDYMRLLHETMNPQTLDSLMCRTTLSVGWDGRLFDCDFNQATGIDLPRQSRSVWTIDSLAELRGAPIAFSDHCFGCTAGAGSSCAGALV
jgi:radical SAM/Cys-rich protein